MSILIADDDVVFRTRLARALSMRGYDTNDAGTIEHAVRLAERLNPERAVVDLRLGKESGLDLVQALIERNPEIDIIVMTGYGSIATAVEAMRRGALNYMQKPCDAQQILEKFEEQQPDELADEPALVPSLARVEWEHIQRVLNDCGGNISETARRLRIHRRSLQRKLFKMQPNE